MCKAVLRSATGLIRRVAVLPLCCADSPTSQTEISYLKSASGCPRSTAQLVGGPLSRSAAPMRNPHSAIQSLQSEIRYSSTARASVSARFSGLARFEATPSGVVYKRPHPHRHPAPPRPTPPHPSPHSAFGARFNGLPRARLRAVRFPPTALPPIRGRDGCVDSGCTR